MSIDHPIDEILCIGLRAFESELATRQSVREFRSTPLSVLMKTETYR